MGKRFSHPETGRRFFVSTRYMNDNPYHYGKRKDPLQRKYIVVHHTAGSTAGDLAVLRGKTDRHVSVKYLVPDPQDQKNYTVFGRFRIYQLLGEDVPGYSVGRTDGPYGYVDNDNSDSIEVSNRGDGTDAFETVQVEAVEALIAHEERRLNHDVRVFGHWQIAPDRKVDPHKSFPLKRVQAFAKRMVRGHRPRG